MKCKTKFVAKEKGLIQLDSKMGYLHAEYCYAEVPSADVLIVPGGAGGASWEDCHCSRRVFRH